MNQPLRESAIDEILDLMSQRSAIDILIKQAKQILSNDGMTIKEIKEELEQYK